MPESNQNKEFINYVLELMQTIGPVSARKMFGGYGIFLEGLMFAIVSDNVLYFKADEDTEDQFVERGLEPFTYQRQGKELKLSYFQTPEELFEDDGEMKKWANQAYKVALKAAKKNKKKSP